VKMMEIPPWQGWDISSKMSSVSRSSSSKK
jgi:hypothetical protein